MSNPAQQDNPEESELFKAVARRIREARLNIGLDHAQFADKLGVKRPYVFELEGGTANPTLRTLHRVARSLGIDPADLLPGSTRPEVKSTDVDALVQVSEGLATLLGERRSQYQQILEQILERELEAVRTLRMALERLRPSEEQLTQDEQPTAVEENPKRKGKTSKGVH
jgi:transcriptional regulator with XRE-family HTH domain